MGSMIFRINAHRSSSSTSLNRVRGHHHGLVAGTCLALMLSFAALNLPLAAQTLANFSGKWEYDKSRSQTTKMDTPYDGTIILEIDQNAKTISFVEIYIKEGNNDFKTSADVFDLSGKVVIRKGQVGTTKKSVKWSQDRKILTTISSDTQTRNGRPQEYLAEYTYTLSDDGRTLTINKHFKNPVLGDLTAQKIYHKR